MIRKVIITVLVALFAAPALAVTIGELQPGGGTVAGSDSGQPLTIISFSRPALASGSIARVRVIWAGAPAGGCANAFKVKFFRPTTGNGVEVRAERGPFNAVSGANDVLLNPEVAIQAGDLIGVTQLLPVNCGGLVNRRSDRNEVWAAQEVDPSIPGTLNSLEYINGLVPSIRGHGANEVPPHGYLTVVGSTQGGFGSLFKTAVQLTNRGSSSINGRLRFRRDGPSPSETNFIYVLAPLETRTFDDIVAEAGATGLGTMDVIPTEGYPPDITARIYNDAGTAGTAGFTQELQTQYDAFYRFDRGSLQVPTDLTNFRMNIGIRTLAEEVTLSAIQYDSAGLATGAAVRRTYPANYFEQTSASQFLEGMALAPGGMIVVQVESGGALFYGTVTDNRTNDSSMRFPNKY